ncbi:MAG: hypothetical protein WCV72_01295 [Patescibacteria group bacterium]|jgi:hypothetical protein
MTEFEVPGIGTVIIDGSSSKHPFFKMKEDICSLTLVQAAENFISVPALRKRVKLLLPDGRLIPICELSEEKRNAIKAIFIQVAQKQQEQEEECDL